MKEYLFKISEMTGTQIYVIKNQAQETNINMDNMPAGICNLPIQSEGKSFCYHVIKKNRPPINTGK